MSFLSGLFIQLSTLQVVSSRPRDDRGDVPGWVMVTVMSATVVAGLLTFIPNELRSMLNAALDMVRT